MLMASRTIPADIWSLAKPSSPPPIRAAAELDPPGQPAVERHANQFDNLLFALSALAAFVRAAEAGPVMRAGEGAGEAEGGAGFNSFRR